MTSTSRKRQRRADRATIKAAKGQKCPDCDSEVGRIVRDRNGVLRAQMIHDDNCPALRGYTPVPRALVTVGTETLTLTARLERADREARE